MLGKLLKHEFKSTARIFIPFYFALIGVAAILKLFTLFESRINILVLPRALFIFLYAVLVAIVFALAYIITCTRFYRNLLGDEGYLMHTLPVKPYLHIWTKLITGIVWLFASILAGLLSVLVLTLRKGLFGDIIKGIDLVFKQLGVILNNSSAGLTLAAFILMLAVVLINSFLMFYASMSVGQLIRRHRVIGSIAAYFGFSFITQMISAVVMFILSKTNTFDVLQNGNVGVINGRVVNIQILNAITAFLLVFSVLYTLTAIGYYIITNYMLKKKLNLE